MAMAVATVSNFPPAAWVSRTPPLPKLPKPPPSAPVDSLSSPLISQFTPKRITSSWYLTAVTVATASATATATAAAVCLLPSGAASAAELAGALPFPAFELSEPSNALSLPTWAIHVSSVVEWVTAMALVWEYGDKSGFESWKGISWAMVPLLGGALCACTWHFFYNSESLEVLVALQAALTVLGNLTMCIAAYRTYKASQELPKKS